MGLRGKDATPLSKRALAPCRNNPWDAPGQSRAERVITFCEDLTVTSGTAAYTKLRLRPWQRKFIEAVYAENKQGIRPVRTAVLSMGRKNGKSQLAAALALCHLSGPEAESRGEVYSCANDRFQAAKIFAEMVAMINNHPWLADRVNIIRFTDATSPAGPTTMSQVKLAISPARKPAFIDKRTMTRLRSGFLVAEA